ncbi:unnamed protein product [Parascedosporium putredinis]|uniref:Uncharacterized protein n=1 Tax=Parascedosporium putredinis TaxID=1442378 RepID=A0A9P1HAP0_9PEZI|nr:unnamed protein product [Parascedosporium putredinis]CAI8002908.1 unnamed protein product [Parascedosporium putredinis]
MEDNAPSSTPPAVDRDRTLRPQRFPSALSTSEPSLSHPDIMNPNALNEPPDESSLLSDSAYEVINNADTESQDGFPTESVCSSDYLQSDDTHSLIGTEHTNDEDDEENGEHNDTHNHVDEDMAYSHVQEPRPQYQDDSEAENTDSDSEELIKFPDFPTHLDKEFEEACASGTTTYTAGGAGGAGEDDDDEDEEERRSSMHYAEESLKMPSALPPGSPASKSSWFGFASNQELADFVSRLSYKLVHGLAVVGLVSVCAFFLQGHLNQPNSAIDAVRTETLVPVMRTTVSVTTSTYIINYTSTKTDAYGVVNITVVTTRKPKVNETFEIDFGKGLFDQALEYGVHVVQDIAETISSSLNGASAENLVPDALRWAEDLGSRAKDSVLQSCKTVEDYLDTANEHVQQVFHDGPTQVKAEWDRRVLDVQEEAKIALLKAQINANLWWLKFQGKTEERKDYLHKARRFMRSTMDEIELARDSAQASKVWRRGMREGPRCKGRRDSGFTRWTQECVHDA